jgi:Spy/CpxP family protein refolding chaperone
MKRYIFAAGLLLIASCLFAAEGGSPFDGTWSGEIEGGGMGGPTTLTYVFKTSGNTLTGTVSSSMDSNETPLKDGKIDGKNISFGADVETGGTTIKYKSKGVLEGDEIKLTYDSEGGGAPGGMMGGGMMGGGMMGGGMMGGGMMGGAPGGTGLSQEQTQKINEAVQADMSSLTTKLEDAQKAAIKAGLAKDATAASIKSKIDAVIKLQTEIAILRFNKGIKTIANEITDDQKTQLEDNAARGYQQLFVGRPGGGAPGGGMMGGGMMGGGMMGGAMMGGSTQSGSITLKKVK